MNEIEWFFYHLWLKPHTMSISISNPKEFEDIKNKRKDMRVVKFPFKIPETILFRSGKLQTWYFRAKEEVILK
jgi:hypothetical protein